MSKGFWKGPRESAQVGSGRTNGPGGGAAVKAVSLTRSSPAHTRGHHGVVLTGPTGLGAAADEVAREQRVVRLGRQMKSCPKCGHVYKRPHLAGPDGACLSDTACERHLRVGY